MTPLGPLGPNIVFTPNHQDVAVDLLLAQYQQRPRIRAFIRALALGVQDLEDRAFGVLVQSTLTAASGDLLDKWGAVVGEPRGSLTDDADYRVFVQARILANRCQGTTDQMIEIWKLLVAPYLEVRHIDNYPASVQFWVVRTDPMSDLRARRVARLMRSVKPGGVSIDMTEAVVGYLGFSENPTAQPLDAGLLARAL